VQYENFSNERWDVISPNITYSKFDNANNWPWHYGTNISTVFLKIVSWELNLRKAFKFKPQVLHYIVSHHISPVAFRKTVGYDAKATNQQQTRVTVLE